MFKALIGRGHPEFSTNRQQDAQEYLLHFINMVEVAVIFAVLSSCTRLLGAHRLRFQRFPALNVAPLSEELPLGGEPVRGLPLPGRGAHRVPAVAQGQVHTEGGLHCAGAGTHGPGHQHG